MALAASSAPRGRPFIGLPLAWAALVLVLTLLPSRNLPELPPWKLVSFDTAAHAFVFVLLSALTVFSLRRQRARPRLRQWAYLLVAVGCIGFGLLIEALQTVMHLGRHGEWSDALSDALGVGAGLLLAYGTRRWWE